MEKETTQEAAQAPFQRNENEATLKAGDKVWFIGEKQPMTIRAASERYAVCIAPFYRQKTVYYSILDFLKQWKAPNDLVFNIYDYETQEGIEESLVDLEAGKYELSRRRGVELSIDWVKTLDRKSKKGKKNG